MGKPQQMIHVYEGERNVAAMAVGGILIVVGVLMVFGGFAAGSAGTGGFGLLVLVAGFVVYAVGKQRRTRPCPRCRTRISPKAEVCPQCQYNLVTPTPMSWPQAVPPSAQEAPPAQPPAPQEAPPPPFRPGS